MKKKDGSMTDEDMLDIIRMHYQDSDEVAMDADVRNSVRDFHAGVKMGIRLALGFYDIDFKEWEREEG